MHEETLLSWLSKMPQGRSDQTDLYLPWAHMYEVRFSDVVVCIVFMER